MTDNTETREVVVSKIYFELIFYAELYSSDYEGTMEIYNKLLSENTVLTPEEKKLCQNRVSRNTEREKVLDKKGDPFECSHCKMARYSMRYCENCIIQYLKSLFWTWTSGNEVIDEFICECQSKSGLPLYIIYYRVDSIRSIRRYKLSYKGWVCQRIYCKMETRINIRLG